MAAKAASALSIDDKELPKVDIDLPEVSLQAPDVDLPEVSLQVPEVDLPEVSLKMPEVDLPEVPSLDVELPTLEVKAPGMDWSGIDPHKPIIDPPDMDISLPTLDVDLPDMSLKMPEVDLPDVSLQAPDVSVDTGSGFLDAAKVAAIAAGAGLAANAVAVDDVSPDSVTDTDWLLQLVQQTKEAYRGRNARAVSRLWGSDSHYDCSTLADYESISLEPATYDKLGSSHCGVPRAGFVAVGGDVGNVEMGSGILFHYCNIVVCRGADNTHHFIRVLAD